jgi:hypothetical protein
MSSTVERRKKDYKKAPDENEGRRKREEFAIKIRTTKRQERQKKRRAAARATLLGEGGGGESALAGVPDDLAGYMAQLKTKLYSDDLDNIFDGVMGFRKLLSIEDNPPIGAVLETGITPRLLEVLDGAKDPKMMFEAAWAVTNIASGESEHTREIVRCEGIPVLRKLLMCPREDVREQAVWALGNIAGDSPELRDRVLDADMLTPILLQFQQSSRITMIRNCTWTLSNFARGKPEADFVKVAPSLGTLAQLLYHDDIEVLTDTCWALSYLTDGENKKIQAVLEAGVARRLIELLAHPKPAVQTPALRTIGNIVTGDEVQTQVALNYGLLFALDGLMTATERRSLRREACWTLSNITAGEEAQLQMVLDCGVFPTLLWHLEQAPFEIRKEAAWAVANAASSGTVDQINTMVQAGCLRGLISLLHMDEPRVVQVALEGLDHILKKGAAEAAAMGMDSNPFADDVIELDGDRIIEELQDHDNTFVYQKAISMLERHFDGEAVDEEGPGVDEEGRYALDTNDDADKGAMSGFQNANFT